MEFFREVNVDQAEAEAIARGLYALAKVDGVHAREAALVAAFFDEAGGGARALAELERRVPITPEELAEALRGEELRRMFLKTALLLAWVDGQVTPEERQLLETYARAFGLAPEAVAELETGVKEYLLGQLAHVQNVESTRAVAQKLKV